MATWNMQDRILRYRQTKLSPTSSSGGSVSSGSTETSTIIGYYDDDDDEEEDDNNPCMEEIKSKPLNGKPMYPEDDENFEQGVFQMDL